MIKTGLIGDQFSSKWSHFSTTITLFNQVIHDNDKVKPKKLSSFTLSSLVMIASQHIRESLSNFTFIYLHLFSYLTTVTVKYVNDSNCIVNSAALKHSVSNN